MKIRFFPEFVAKFSVLLALALPLMAQPDRITTRIDNTRRVVLRGSRSPRALPQEDQGPADARRQIRMLQLHLKPSAAQQAVLEQLLEDQHNPESPDYHAWLSPEEFADRFGASLGDWSRVLTWLRSEGFSVDYEGRARNMILFSGSVAQIQSTFKTEMHVFREGASLHYANSTDPSIPAALEPIVQMIAGLDDFRLQPAQSKQIVPEASAVSAIVPSSWATIYDLNPLYQIGIDGTGQSIVVVGQTDFNMNDVISFRSKTGLPAKNPPVIVKLVPGSADPGTIDDEGEAILDVEWAGGIGRNATIYFSNSTNVVASTFYAIDQNMAPVISMSYGGCEQLISSTPASALATIQQKAQQANAQGMTWVASSGDTGAAGCERQGVNTAGIHGPAVLWPVSIPEVTGVGGLEFNEGGANYWDSNGNALGYIPEKVWNDTAIEPQKTLAAGGGGVSTVFKKPAWQTGTGVPNDNARDVPDVAFTASWDHDPYAVIFHGQAAAFGGTSAAAPSFAGVLSLLNQYALSKGFITKAGLANINPTLYRLAQSSPGMFHDVTIGNNIVPCQTGSTGCTAGQYGYNAGVGYDPASGLGSVDAYKLITGWNGTTVTPTTTTVSANPSSFASTATTTLTATVKANSGTASPGGTVTFTSGANTLGTAALSGSGGTSTASLTVNGGQLSNGNNTITASYGGAAGFGTSNNTVIITITAPTGGATTTSLAANPASIPTTGSTSLTATVRAGSGTTSPTGAVTFTLGNVTLGSGNLSGSGGTATASLTVNGNQLSAGANTITATYGGGGGFGGSVATTVVTVTVSSTSTSTAVSANPQTLSASGNTVIFATVTPASGSATPTGNVNFTAGGANLGSSALTPSGIAGIAAITVNGSQLAAGNNTITASYAGGNGFGASSGTVVVTVGSGGTTVNTTTTLAAVPASITTGTTTNLTATVTAVSGGATPSGQVAFVVGNTTLGSATVSAAGIASLTVAGSLLSLGANTITAHYGGGVGFNGSAASATVTVSLPSSGSAVVPSVVPNPIYEQQPDADGYTFFFTLRLSEIAGASTTLNGFSFTTPDGVNHDYSSSITSFFGSANLQAKGTLSAALRATTSGAPIDWLFTFKGNDANGQPWTQQLQVPFLPGQISASMLMSSSPGTVVQNPNGNSQCNAPFQFFFQQLNLQEQNGYEVQLTKFLAGGNDLSANIPQWFGSWRLAPLGTLQAGICWNIGNPPATLSYEIDGVDTAGNKITTTASIPFNTAPSSAGGALSATPSGGGKTIVLSAPVGSNSRSATVAVNVAAGQQWSATLFPANQKSSWLVVFPQSGTGPGTVNLVASTGGLASGLYAATLVLQSVNTIPQFVNVPITFVVGTTGNVSIGGISNTFSAGLTFAPGMLLTVYGNNMAGGTQPATQVPLPYVLQKTSASVNGVPAPLYYVSPGQINIQLPYEIPVGPAVLAINNNGQIATWNFTVSQAAPGLHGSIFNGATPVSSAAPGQPLTLYLTGEGDVLPFVATGIPPAGSDYTKWPQPRLPLVLTVGGVVVTPSFFAIPNWSVGVTQINFTVPNVAKGPQQITVKVGSAPSQALNLNVTNAAANVQFQFVPPSVNQSSDGSWKYTTILKETTGVGVTLTKLVVFGNDYTGNINSWFNGTRIPAGGSLQGPFVATCTGCGASWDGTWQITGTDDNGNTGTWSGIVHFLPPSVSDVPPPPEAAAHPARPPSGDMLAPIPVSENGRHGVVKSAPFTPLFDLLFHSGAIRIEKIDGAANAKDQ